MTSSARTTSVGYYVSKKVVAIPHSSGIRCFRYGGFPLHPSTISCCLDPLEFLMVVGRGRQQNIVCVIAVRPI
jgi:hypothetical protein